jgi:hypothetical protein
MFVIKQGDTAPAISGILTTTAVLTGASAEFIMQDDSGDIVIQDTATVYTASNSVIYQWGAGETDIPGKYKAEFRLTYQDNRIETFPNVGQIDVYIEPKLEDEVTP